MQKPAALLSEREFEENIEHGMEELRQQYADVMTEGHRSSVKMPALEGLAQYFEQR
jgi:hypothetical protein